MVRLTLASLVAFASLTTPAAAEQFIVRSFDGTRIVTNFFPARGLEPGERAPTVLQGPGYSSGGETDPGSGSSEATGGVGLGPLRAAGYNVVTWDPRGFGGSGGNVQVDSPKHEARDVQAIIDVIARRREVLLDAPGDPRVGMTGISYGGGIQFVTAQRDRRVDAIAPGIAWHSLVTSLFKDGALKAGWGLVLCGSGTGTGLAAGIFAPQGIETGSQDPVITRTCTQGTATGRVPPEDVAWFGERGPAHLVRRIRIPTLIVQGTVDTLFTLREAMDNHAILRSAGVPLKMLWFCGGHGVCGTGDGPARLVERRVLAWLDRHLRGRRVDTGPAFEWVADDGARHSGPGFPPPRTGELRGTGAGTLPLNPAANTGLAIAATPAAPGTALEVEVAPTGGPTDILGEPHLRLAYSGTASPERTWIYAQVVDGDRRRVAGNVVTPIPLVLDGKARTVERPLEPVALRAAGGAVHRLQLVPSTTLYYPQQSEGVLEVRRAEVSLPVVDAGSARPSRAERRGRRARASCPGSRRGFRSVHMRTNRGRVRFEIRRRIGAPYRVVLRRDGRRLERVPTRPRRFGWRPPRLAEGRYAIRLTMPLPGGARDVRQARLTRERGRLAVGRVRVVRWCAAGRAG